MSSWNHAVCGDCWVRQRSVATAEGVSIPKPARALEAEPMRCCYCARWTMEGIFVRSHPAETPCRGEHVAGEHVPGWVPA